MSYRKKVCLSSIPAILVLLTGPFFAELAIWGRLGSITLRGKIVICALVVVALLVVALIFVRLANLWQIYEAEHRLASFFSAAAFVVCVLALLQLILVPIVAIHGFIIR